MAGVGKYILSVTAVCICCSLVRRLVGEKGSASGVIRSICGIILAVSVLTPILKIKFKDFSAFTSNVQFDADSWVQDGIDRSDNALRTIISEKTTAYILEKASAYECSIDQLEVDLSADSVPVPSSLVIYGTFSPSVRNQLSRDVETNLGIPKEKQQWIYQN